MTMNERLKPLYILLYAIPSLVLFAFTSSGASHIFSKDAGMLVGLVLMIAAIPLYLLGDRNKFFYIICMTLNILGMGLAASSYYTTKEAEADVAKILFASIIPMLILLICSVALLFKLSDKTKKAITLTACVLIVALIIVSIVFWAKRGGEYYAFSVFSALVTVTFLGALIYCIEDEDRNALPCSALGSFGPLWIVAGLVFIFMGVGKIFGECCGENAQSSSSGDCMNDLCGSDASDDENTP